MLFVTPIKTPKEFYQRFATVYLAGLVVFLAILFIEKSFFTAISGIIIPIPIIFFAHFTIYKPDLITLLTKERNRGKRKRLKILIMRNFTLSIFLALVGFSFSLSEDISEVVSYAPLIFSCENS